MKKSLIIFSVILIAGLLFWLCIRDSLIASKKPLETDNASTNSIASVNSAQKYEQTPQQTNGQATQMTAQMPVTNSANKPDSLTEWMNQEYSHPIEFYGKVAKEDESPISNASISFDWVKPDGNGLHASTVSDGNGMFSITNIKGKNLRVTVSKNGYYPRASNFEYADPSRGLFTPDARNPVVFHLRKRGNGTDLITSQKGLSPSLQVHIPRDGTSIKVDFLQRTAGDNGQMQISESKPEYKSWQQATAWSFQMSIQDGGFIGENDEYPFTAPENGYQPVVSFSFQKNQSDWAENINTNYYIEFGNPPCFGRLHIETSISYGGATLTYVINPSGSQNLEPK